MAVPVVLFVYNRPEHLRRTLNCLRENHVSQIYAFSDGPRAAGASSSVAEVRQILREVDWCEIVVSERPDNLGLGRSIRAGVSAVLEQHPAVIVSEDDLICVPGTYDYLGAALEYYRDDSRVMSVTGWTHPSVIPNSVTHDPYFDGRAECLVWGTWRRSWQGMDMSAMQLLRQCQAKGIDVYRYGADLPAMAEIELDRNIWAVRWLFLHMLRGGLCLRPPHSLVEHIGFDSLGTNATDGSVWSNPPLKPCPPIPNVWPAAVQHPDCERLWRQAYGSRPSWLRRTRRRVGNALRALGVMHART